MAPDEPPRSSAVWPPQANRTAKVRGLDHATALGDLDASLEGETSRRIVDARHQRSPCPGLGTSGGQFPRRLARTDRDLRRPAIEQVDDRLLRLASARSRTAPTGRRAVADRVPIPRPLASPFEAASAGRAGLRRRRGHGGLVVRPHRSQGGSGSVEVAIRGLGRPWRATLMPFGSSSGSPPGRS